MTLVIRHQRFPIVIAELTDPNASFGAPTQTENEQKFMKKCHNGLQSHLINEMTIMVQLL